MLRQVLLSGAATYWLSDWVRCNCCLVNGLHSFVFLLPRLVWGGKKNQHLYGPAFSTFLVGFQKWQNGAKQNGKRT